MWWWKTPLSIPPSPPGRSSSSSSGGRSLPSSFVFVSFRLCTCRLDSFPDASVSETRHFPRLLLEAGPKEGRGRSFSQSLLFQCCHLDIPLRPLPPPQRLYPSQLTSNPPSYPPLSTLPIIQLFLFSNDRWRSVRLAIYDRDLLSMIFFLSTVLV